MHKTIAIGKQDFASTREQKCFYVDKTNFISEWWEKGDDVTLITRPRRFGKTLNMSMLECFFSNSYVNRGDLFEKLKIWESEKYRNLQGTKPVIFLSFAKIKSNTYKMMYQDICRGILDLYLKHMYLLDSEVVPDGIKELLRDTYTELKNSGNEIIVKESINLLARALFLHFDTKPIIILDEYDTPMQEAYLNHYWDEMVSFVRTLFNASFKTNPYMEKAIMTGITRVSKESIFSDLNNINVVTTSSNEYETCFGFSEEEVFETLEVFGLAEAKNDVKKWYDGFLFGKKKDIYNPWSIINFIDKGELQTYWADSSSNKLVSDLAIRGSANLKLDLGDLVAGRIIEKQFDEQLVFEQLDKTEDAIWSLLLASGYISIDSFRYDERTKKKIYSLKLTNFEVTIMFEGLIKNWFADNNMSYNAFINALLNLDLESMNQYMNDVALTSFSSFDTGRDVSEIKQPERFYHGFVLGLLVDLRGRYVVLSNRESGFGRYDVMLIPTGKYDRAYVLEFKVLDKSKEKTIEETADSALKQIEEKKYDADLISMGIEKNRIVHFGFAFEGKKVLIKNDID